MTSFPSWPSYPDVFCVFFRMKTAESVSASGSDSGRSLDWDEEDEVEVDDGGSVSSDKASLQRHLAQGKTYTLRRLLRNNSNFMILLSFFHPKLFGYTWDSIVAHKWGEFFILCSSIKASMFLFYKLTSFEHSFWSLLFTIMILGRLSLIFQLPYEHPFCKISWTSLLAK